MPFVMRDEAGQVVAIFREMSAGAEEYLPPTDAAIQGFVQQNMAQLPIGTAEKPAMLQSDLDMIRVYEDLTDILLSKNVIMLTDFPPAAQDKLIRRKRLRSSLSPITELLAGTDDDEQELL